MEKAYACVERLCKMKETIMAVMEAELAAKGACADTAECGAVVDMIKDLCEAEKDCYKAVYYRTIVEAMEEASEDEYEGRAGYDHYRYSSGRFAPKGHGHRSGYTPKPTTTHMMDGFNPGSMRIGYMDRPHSPYGDSYDRWQDSRRHYSESHDQTSKMEMDQHAQDHVKKMMASIQEMWQDADPEVRRKMKMDLKGFTDNLQA